MSPRERYDAIVLGGGSAGLAHALRAARHGAKVALLEPGHLGGTCVNVGCVPKKAMWLAANLADSQQLAKSAGFAISPGELDWPAFVARREAYIERIRGNYRQRLEEAGVVVIGEAGRFVDRHGIDTPTRRLEGRHIVIATGSRPRHAGVPGAGLGVDSDGFFALREAPRRVAIIGGGYIAVELAGILCALGTQVDVFVRGGRLLEGFDSEAVDVLARRMRARGVQLSFGCNAKSLARTDEGGLAIAFDDGAHRAGFDRVIWAIGRRANVDSLDLARSGLVLDAGGHIAVDEWQDTAVERVHALGDVTGRLALTPVATASARCLADRLFGGNDQARLDYANVPSVVFGSLPLGSVGIDEACARERHGTAVKVYRTQFRPMLDAVLERDETTFMKLVCVGDEQRIVGIQMVGRSVDEMLQGFAVALKLGARKADFDATVAIHPTAAEELVLMR